MLIGARQHKFVPVGLRFIDIQNVQWDVQPGGRLDQRIHGH